MVSSGSMVHDSEITFDPWRCISETQSKLLGGAYVLETSLNQRKSSNRLCKPCSFVDYLGPFFCLAPFCLSVWAPQKSRPTILTSYAISWRNMILKKPLCFRMLFLYHQAPQKTPHRSVMTLCKRRGEKTSTPNAFSLTKKWPVLLRAHFVFTKEDPWLLYYTTPPVFTTKLLFTRRFSVLSNDEICP